MRRLAAAFALLLCAAPPAGAKTRDFEVRVPGGKVVRTDQRFDVFGVRWQRAPRHLHARVHDPRRGWRRWVEVGMAHSGRSSDPVWAGGADAVQLRVEGPAKGLRLHFVHADPPAPRAYAAARQAPAQSGPPPIVPRADWGGDQCPPRDPPRYGEVRLAFVHHTVTANDYAPEDSRAMVLGICRYHRNSNGWDDIGYNFLVDKYGTIFEGRAGGVDRAVVGAQAQGYNSVSTGVANLGDYERVPQTEAALQAVGQLLAWKLPLHGAPVEGQVSVVSGGGDSNRYAAGQTVTFERISGHRDGNATACPGAQLYAQLGRIRELAAGRAPAAAPPASDGVPAALSLQPVAPVVPFGEPIRVGGRLIDLAGAGVPGRKVKVEIGTTKGWLAMTSTTTGPDGSWSAEFPATRSWDVRAIHNEIASPRVRVVVAPLLSASLRARRVRAGRSAIVSGTIRPGRAAILVEAWRQASPTSTRYVRAFTVRRPARGGRFRARVALRRPGLYRLRVKFPGDRRNGPAQAGDLFVRAVRGPTGGTSSR